MNRDDLQLLDELYNIPLPSITEPTFNDNQRRIYELRYSRKDKHEKPTESPRQTIWRVASNVAIVEALYAGEAKLGASEAARLGEVIREELPFPLASAARQYNYLLREGRITNSFFAVMQAGRDAWYEKALQYAELIASLKFLPNSPTWSGAGTKLGQLAACFVLPIADNLGRDRDSIFETLKVAALIQQTGGGNGFSFASLRPNGMTVTRSMGQATGPVGFLKVYNAAFDVIAQGGTRRGANMGVLRISHPDVARFIGAKSTEGDLKNFNISVAIEDAFMDAVREDTTWPLIHEGVVYGEIKARDLYDMIIEGAWRNGEPGSLFIDAANRTNPNPARYSLEATNPCGEQWLGGYENCCLGSINLEAFVDWDEGVDWEGLRATIELSTRFLDDVVDANAYVAEVPELEMAAQGARRIGLGGMGLHGAMLKLGIRYGADDGLEFASQIGEFMRYHAMRTSIELAHERGAFPWITDSIYDQEKLRANGPGAPFTVYRDGQPVEATLWQVPSPLVEHDRDFGRPECDWQTVTEGLTEHGIRNSAQLTFAPTGTISNVAGTEGSGCEPIFALKYVRNVTQEGQEIQLAYLSELFAEALRRAGVDETTHDLILGELKNANYGSVAQIVEVPEAVRRVFVVTSDISPEEHVRTQAVLQRFVDNSISKTVNLPNEATLDDVKRVYRLAYELGCKGITVYRQGSREEEVLTTKTNVSSPWPVAVPMSIPDEAYDYDHGLQSRTHGVNTPFGRMWTTVTEHPEHPGRPFDVRITIGKAGNDKQADLEAIGRLTSLSLRAGISVDEIIDQLDGIGGYSRIGFGENKVLSTADGLARLLTRCYQGKDEESESLVQSETTIPHREALELCSHCKRHTVVVELGCRYCKVELGGCGKNDRCD